ncbi:hypothetical protein KY290_032831 [Solanum tuberosum]|uniref:Integrase core domain containing protein n=1 Tax=Solanum tuberosum TaxID=4113 RepID=A0ABQ7UDA6_SOLTU|nr:hypothetical protein KY290_032831 [Solanum tuberosum]
MVKLFLSGLRQDIKTNVLVHKPTFLDEAILLAQTHEQRLQLERGPMTPALTKTQPLLPTPQSRSFVPARNNPNALSRVPVKRLSLTEMQQRREKGLSYYCDEKYTTNHMCKTLSRILLLGDDPDALLSVTEQLTSDEMLAEELQALEV